MSEETAPQMLSRLGTDGKLWAQEFNITAVSLGYSKMDEDWLVGWFCNAIENCDFIRGNALRAENERLREALKPFSLYVKEKTKTYEYEGIQMALIDHDKLMRACIAARKALGETDE